jgi:hypothetical protein
MSDPFNRANQALFDGNRGDITHHVPQQADSGRALWLLAAAAEDNDERLALLAQVDATREQPYADMAREILERERWYAEELGRTPGWQVRLQRIARRLLRVVIAVPLLLLVLWLGSRFIFSDSAPTQPSVTDTRSGAAPPPTAIPTPALPLLANPATANYMPTGVLRILSVAFPAQVESLPPAPTGFVYLLMHYEFTCGSVTAVCDAVPQGQLAVELADPNAAPITEATLPWNRDAASVEAGGRVQRWALFTIPASQTPRRLHIMTAASGTNDPVTLATVEIPR